MDEQPITCPHCGSESGVKETYQNFIYKVFFVECSLCGARGPYALTPALAVWAWNKMPQGVESIHDFEWCVRNNFIKNIKIVLVREKDGE